MSRIYLDNAATTFLEPNVREAMEPWLDCGNPSSLHSEGRRAKAAIDEARERLSNSLGCDFGEVIFTGGGTEAANFGVVGGALSQPPSRNRILISAAEHHCVLHTKPLLERLGYRVEFVAVDRLARPDPEDLAAKLGEDVALVATMHANNELGTLTDVRGIAELVRPTGALLFVDAVQSFRAIAVTPKDLGADLLSVSGHKVGGPKGVGALYVRAGVKPVPISIGGGQERELRAGTENVAAIVGFGVAATMDRPSPREARDLFESQLPVRVARTVPDEVGRLPGHSHLRVPGVRSESLLILLDRLGVSASAGAACSSGAVEASHVLRACGYSESEALEGIRMSFGSQTSLKDAERAAEVFATALQRFS